jgi:predicted dehydrogenase
MTSEPLRIGTLGAARITPSALCKPASTTPGVVVAAVAARDTARAEAFAAKRGIPRVHDSYEALIADPEIDAIYNPLPNGLHGVWTIRALEAGKHVLCEKPFTANAAEAERVAAVADAHPQLVLMEAFHWRYHPLAQRIRDIVASGELGEIQHITSAMCIPLPLPNDIRWRWDLAGGSLMDTGCYAIHFNRHLGMAGEPVVTRAGAKTLRKESRIDRWIDADLAYPGGVTGRVTAAMWSARVLDTSVRITGSAGELRCFNPTQPALYHRLTVTVGNTKRRERDPDRRHTYWHQLQAFAAAVAGERERNLTPVTDSIANMRVIDAIYTAAGLPPREPSA